MPLWLTALLLALRIIATLIALVMGLASAFAWTDHHWLVAAACTVVTVWTWSTVVDLWIEP